MIINDENAGLEKKVSDGYKQRYGDIVLTNAYYSIGAGKKRKTSSGTGSILKLLLTYPGIAFDTDQLLDVAGWSQHNYPHHASLAGFRNTINRSSQYVEIVQEKRNEGKLRIYSFKAVIHESQRIKA